MEIHRISHYPVEIDDFVNIILCIELSISVEELRSGGVSVKSSTISHLSD